MGGLVVGYMQGTCRPQRRAHAARWAAWKARTASLASELLVAGGAQVAMKARVVLALR